MNDPIHDRLLTSLNIAGVAYMDVCDIYKADTEAGVTHSFEVRLAVNMLGLAIRGLRTDLEAWQRTLAADDPRLKRTSDGIDYAEGNHRQIRAAYSTEAGTELRTETLEATFTDLNVNLQEVYLHSFGSLTESELEPERNPDAFVEQQASHVWRRQPGGAMLLEPVPQSEEGDDS